MRYLARIEVHWKHRIRCLPCSLILKIEIVLLDSSSWKICQWTSICPRYCPLDLGPCSIAKKQTPKMNNNNQDMALMHKQEWWHDILSYWNQPYYIIINLNRVGTHNTLQFHKPHSLWMWYFVLLIRQGSKLIKHAWFWYQNADLIFMNILIGHLHFLINIELVINFTSFTQILKFWKILKIWQLGPTIRVLLITERFLKMIKNLTKGPTCHELINFRK
jgi:hypothetical protein